MPSCPITILVNVTARRGVCDQVEALAAACARVGLSGSIQRVSGDAIVGVAERAAATRHVLVAAGGDGTASAVASVAVRTGATFGVVPLGTLNHFARDIGMPLDLDGAVAVIAAGRTRLLDTGELNGHTFVNNASLGLYPRLVRDREMQQQSGRAKWPAFAVALLRTWFRYRPITVHIDADDVPLVRRTPFVFVGNGIYQIQGPGLGSRSSLEAGRLSVLVAPECGRVELLGLSLRALVKRLTPDTKFEAFAARDLSIEVARHHIMAALDGELVTVEAPLRCAIRPRSLRTIVPEVT